MAKKTTSKRRVDIVTPSGKYEPEEIRYGVVKRTQYRDRKTGRFTRKRRGAKREVYEYRIKEMGEIASGRIVPLEDSFKKVVDKGNLDQWDGMIKDAMMAENVFTAVQNINAAMVDIFLTGYDGKTKVSIQKSLDIRDIRKRHEIGELMVGKIIDRLSSMGYRTDYPIEVVQKWSKKQTRRKDALAKKVLQRARITFRIRHD